MSDDELLAYIFSNLAHSVVSAFRLWIGSSDRFRVFAVKHKDKIRSKVRGAIKDPLNFDEKLRDIQFELEVAYLLLQSASVSEVEYEKGKRKGKGSDFTVTCDTGIVFNAEVKRIREADAEMCFNKWEEYVAAQVTQIPSSTLILQMRIGDPDDLGSYKPNLLNRLEEQVSEIIAYIRKIAQSAEADIAVGSEEAYVVPGFEGELILDFSKPMQRQRSDTLQCRRSYRPIFYTQEEYRKFGDLICDPGILDQLQPGMINILVVASESETHEDVDLTYALSLIQKNDDAFFVKKGFKGGKAEFFSQYKKLSGIAYRNQMGVADRCVLLRNYVGECQIPENLEQTLKASLSA
jgi:hypothetical protein